MNNEILPKPYRGNCAVCLDDKERLPLLTVVQTEELLTDAARILKDYDNWYVVEKVLVACCRHAWNIDVQLAMAGVCYHGNAGEPPESILAGLRLLSHNYQ